MRSKNYAGGYEAALIRSYTFPAISFATTTTQKIPVPKIKGRGLQGKVLSVELQRVSTTFAGTTPGAVRVGDGSDDDKYFDTGTVLGAAVTTAVQAKEFEDDGAAVNIEAARSDVTVSNIAPVTGPAGVADVTVVIAWF